MFVERPKLRKSLPKTLSVEDIDVLMDEIHRLHKDIQDVLLPQLESGLITLIGMTTSIPFSISSRARSKATWAVLLLGDRAISATIVPRGILASGKPTLSAALIAASTLGPMAGLAKPISSNNFTLYY